MMRVKLFFLWMIILGFLTSFSYANEETQKEGHYASLTKQAPKGNAWTGFASGLKEKITFYKCSLKVRMS